MSECSNATLETRIAVLYAQQKADREWVRIQFEAKENALKLAAANEAQRRMFSVGIVMLVLSFVSGIIGGAIIRWLVP